jgi:hypothetical protein
MRVELAVKIVLRKSQALRNFHLIYKNVGTIKIAAANCEGGDEMVRAYDQGSHLPCGPQGARGRRGVCLELDYRRTIISYMGRNTKKHKSPD